MDVSIYVLVSQSCLTLCDPVNCSPPGSSVHGILQARILEWIAIPFSRGSSWPRDQIQVSHIGGRFFTIWVTRWMWELNHKEGWVPKNWWFWTVVLEKTLRVPWNARRSNQSILKEINSEYSLEGLMLKLNVQYFGHLMRRANSLEKTLRLGKLKAGGGGDDRGWDGWMASLTQ